MEPLQSRRVAVGRVVAEVRLRTVRRPPEVELGVGRVAFGVMVRADHAGRRPPEPRLGLRVAVRGVEQLHGVIDRGLDDCRVERDEVGIHEPRQPERGERRGAVLRGLRGLGEVRGRRNG